MSDLNLHSEPPVESLRAAAPRVLVLESDSLIKQLIVEWLQRAGFQTQCTSDAGSAARLAEAGCDLILADVSAPFKSAREAVARLTHAVPDTPVIAMSADALASGRSASDAIARELGVAAVLVKPFTQDALLNAIHRVRNARG
jgi:CheY-like chemotaxis protein